MRARKDASGAAVRRDEGEEGRDRSFAGIVENKASLRSFVRSSEPIATSLSTSDEARRSTQERGGEEE